MIARLRCKMLLVPFILLILLCRHFECAQEPRSFFSWGSESEASDKDQAVAVPGYKPILQVHKYNTISINPIDGSSPVYYKSPSPITSEWINAAGRSSLSGAELRYLDMLYEAVGPVLADEGWRNLDPNQLLPFVNLLPEEAINRLRFAIEKSSNTEVKKKTKFLALLSFLKELKLKPLKFVVKIGSELYHKKKKTAQDAVGYFIRSVTTSTPSSETLPPVQGYPSVAQSNQLNYPSQPQLKIGSPSYYESSLPTATAPTIPSQYFANNGLPLPYVEPPIVSPNFYQSPVSLGHYNQFEQYSTHTPASSSFSANFPRYPEQLAHLPPPQFQLPPHFYNHHKFDLPSTYNQQYHAAELETAASEDIQKLVESEAESSTSSEKPITTRTEDNKVVKFSINETITKGRPKPSKIIFLHPVSTKSPISTFPNVENVQTDMAETEFTSSPEENSSSGQPIL